MVQATEEHGFKSHLGEQTGVGLRMPEGVQVPSDARVDSELFVKELVADHHVVDYIIEIRVSFIIGAPSSIDDLELAVLDQILNNFFFLRSLLVVPDSEEAHLSIGELALGVLLKLLK